MDTLGKFKCVNTLALVILTASLFMADHLVYAAEITWDGSNGTSWTEGENWEDGVPPGPDDVALIPDVDNQPLIEEPYTTCAGLVLQQGATLTVDTSDSLYIIGPGDLDLDGVPDIREREVSETQGILDADNDGIPNFAETDSDNDGKLDTCEFAYYPRLNPYKLEETQNTDGDGSTDLQECRAGTNPIDSEDDAADLNAVGTTGLIATVLTLASLVIVRQVRSRKNAIRLLSLLVCAGLFTHVVRHESNPAWAAIRHVDFALGHTLHGQAAGSADGDTLEINGASLRPWNGASTYLSRPLTIEAVGGPVYLGGMRATASIGLTGEGSVALESSFVDSSHPQPVDDEIDAGHRDIDTYLGERLTLQPEAELGWQFSNWNGAASGSDDPLAFQVNSRGLRVTAAFGPPGPDLATSISTPPPGTIKAGEILACIFTIKNIGHRVTEESDWTDGIFLSRDDDLDDRDLLLQSFPRNAALPPADSYTISLSIPAPDVAPGRYYVLGVTDVIREVEESTKTNNMVTNELVVLDTVLAN